MKKNIIFIIASTAFLLLCTPVHSKELLDIVISGGIDKGRPIAIIPFENARGTRPPVDIAEVVTRDLSHSGRFNPIPISQIPLALRKNPLASLDYWREKSIEAVVTGHVTEDEDSGRYHIEYTLWDVLSQPRQPKPQRAQVHSTEKPVQSEYLRAQAHRIADHIFSEQTGILGAFSTRIAYVSVNRDDRQYPFKLHVADYDGYHPQTVLRSSEPLMSPSWSPDGRSLAYVSFENKRAEIYTHDIYTQKRRKLTSYPRINGAPKWSPDGSKMAMVLSKDGQPNIYIMHLDTKRLQKLTHSFGIDTEPTWTPDGQSIIYTSDRGGRPQIYKTSIDSSSTKRLTWNGDTNLAAVLTPLQEQLVVVSRVKKDYRIARHDLNTGFMQVLTETSLDESPTIAPNGSMIMYSTVNHDNRQVLALVSMDGRFKATLPAQDGDIRFPAWSPYLDTLTLQ